MNHESKIHIQTIKNSQKVCDWYKEQVSKLPYPIYSSYDIRDAGYKVANVDANIYPAGFNNICPADKETSVGLMEKFIHSHYGSSVRRILLVTEEHTQNPYYWENVWTLQNLISEAGFEIKIGFPKPLASPLEVTSSTGRLIQVQSADPAGHFFKEYNPDLVVSNNDFSESHEEWGHNMHVNLNPPREMGWYQRKKSRYFKFYNQLANEFCKIAELDPFLLRVETELFEHFDIASEASRAELAAKVDEMIARLRVEYQSRGINQEPFVFVKNNAGTYGLAVIRVGSGEEVKAWSYKSRKKMKAAKGGRDVEEVIIQEGIPSVVQAENASAEPVIYMIGSDLAGGFLRTHSEKSSTDSLNSPGAVYKRLCVSDLALKPEGCPLENVYGWVAKLGLLAIAFESQEMGVEYKGFQVG